MFERIVAAIDSDEARSEKVLKATIQLARAFEAQVMVAHVRELERPAAMVAAPRAGALPPALHAAIDDRGAHLITAALDRLRAAGVAAVGEASLEATGSTARDLLEVAAAHRATLIVVGDRGAPVSDLLLGSVANRITHLAGCSVLLVR